MKTVKETIEGIHWHFVVVAGDNFKTEEDDVIMQAVVQLDILEADSEEEAVEVAKNKIKRDIYSVRQMRQCAQCGLQKEMLREIKKSIKMEE